MRGRDLKKKQINFVDALIVLVAFFGLAYSLITEPNIFSWNFLMSSLALLSGTFYAVLSAKGFRAGYIFLIINALTCAGTAYINNLLGNAAVNLFYFLPTAFLGLYLWGKNERKDKKVIAKKMSASWLIVIFLVSGFLSWIVKMIVEKFGGSMAVFDSVATIFGIVANLLAVFRFREQWVFWIIVDVILLYIWIGAGDLCMLALRIVYTVSAVYGFLNWRKLLIGKSARKVKKA